MNTDQEEKNRCYSETRTDLLTRQLSNSERLDGAILTLSTAALGVSIAFIDNIVPIEKAGHLGVLICSWCLFGLSITSTLISFLTSQEAIKIQLHFAEEYYLNNKEEYFKKQNSAAKWTNKLNYSSAILFIAALCFTITFITLNLGGTRNMSLKNGSTTSKRGATIPNLRPTTKVQNGAEVPSLRPAPASQTGGGATTGGGNTQGGGGQPAQPSQGTNK